MLTYLHLHKVQVRIHRRKMPAQQYKNNCGSLLSSQCSSKNHLRTIYSQLSSKFVKFCNRKTEKTIKHNENESAGELLSASIRLESCGCCKNVFSCPVISDIQPMTDIDLEFEKQKKNETDNDNSNKFIFIFFCSFCAHSFWLLLLPHWHLPKSWWKRSRRNVAFMERVRMTTA